MKPNDKAIEAARAAILKMISYQNSLIEGRVDNESNTNEIDRSDAIKYARVALDAAYAAQFQSEDYAGLIEELRAECRDWLTADCVEKAADALEAVLAERDALKAERDALLARFAPSDNDCIEIGEGIKVEGAKFVTHENSSMLASGRFYIDTSKYACLAPVNDDKLREIAAKHVAGIDGHSDDWDRYVDEAKDYIDAVRPHIKAAERERCAKKILETNWVDADPEEIAAAIREGK